MPWWTITKPTVGEATKKQAFADKVIDNLVYLYGLIGGVSAGAGGGSLIPNGSFESDEDVDGIPDGWSETEYTAGAGSYETTDIAHGKKAYKFVSPGATGGGDLTTTDFFPVTPNRPVAVEFLLKCTAAGVHVLVEFLWYTAAEAAASPSSVAVYDSTANPTDWTTFMAAAIPPANARLAKLRLVGAKNDTATAGTVYFDGVSVREYNGNLHNSGTIAEGSAYHSSFTDDASFVLPVGSFSADCVLRLHFVAEGKIESTGGGYIGHMRFRVGAAYSNDESFTTASYDKRHFTLDVPLGTSGAITVYVQTWNEVGSLLTYWKKPDPDVMIEVLVP